MVNRIETNTGANVGLPASRELKSSRKAAVDFSGEFAIGTNFIPNFPEIDGVDGLMERLFRDDASVVDVAGAEDSAGITINKAPAEGTRDHGIEYSGKVFPTMPLPPIGFGFPLLSSENPDAEELYARADRE